MRKFRSIYWIAFALASCTQPKAVIESATEIDSREAVEFISPNSQSIDSLVREVVSEGQNVYSWKNHSFVFGQIKDMEALESKVSLFVPDVFIKEYNEPLYIYDKTIHCEDKTVVKEWKDYLLTANLVGDTLKQNEYIEYHATQFEEWPEVAHGFCNADFQQLLVYKTGRQLLLVISIPADKTLDELNPKTVENNPRVDEWNAIMAQYQEGIEGTEEGETWVFLE